MNSWDGNKKIMADRKAIERSKFLQNILIVSLVFSPFTALRFGIAGVCEYSIILLFIELLLWRFKIQPLFNLSSFPFTFFWIVFTVSTVCGLIYNQLFVLPPSGSLSGALFNLASYIFVLFCCFSVEFALGSINDPAWSQTALKRIFLYLTAVLSVLWVVSRFVQSIFGLKLRYYLYFVPLATNLHHVSMVIAPLPFVGLWCMSREKRFSRKIAFFAMSIWMAVMGLQTGSSKIMLGLVFGVFLLAFYELFRISRTRTPVHVIYVSIIVIVFIVAVFPFISRLVNDVSELFVSLDGGGARDELYKEAIPKILESPVFGFGPGSHIYKPWMAPNNSIWWDAHQSYIGAYLQGGIVAFLSFVIITMYVLSRTYRNKYLLSASVTIFIYSAGGDILRRLPCWLFLILFVYASSAKSAFPSIPKNATVESI